MRLLASTDFALRVLMRLAAAAEDEILTVEQLARDLGGLSRNHLHKVVQDLAALDLVRTSRGPRGGVALAAPPAGIRLGELIRRLEADQPLVECFRADGGCCTLSPACRLRGLLGQARESFLATLDRHTLADCMPADGFPGIAPLAGC
jgi:Rrf2 family nitric oxide-sensitive transcriptional repressor